MVSKLEEFQEYVANCRRMGERAEPFDKQHWLAMAAHWMQMAEAEEAATRPQMGAVPAIAARAPAPTLGTARAAIFGWFAKEKPRRSGAK
jgi:hypothetical protein